MKLSEQTLYSNIIVQIVKVLRPDCNTVILSKHTSVNVPKTSVSIQQSYKILGLYFLHIFSPYLDKDRESKLLKIVIHEGVERRATLNKVVVEEGGCAEVSGAKDSAFKGSVLGEGLGVEKFELEGGGLESWEEDELGGGFFKFQKGDGYEVDGLGKLVNFGELEIVEVLERNVVLQNQGYCWVHQVLKIDHACEFRVFISSLK